MHLNGPWKILLIALTLVVVWFATIAFYQLYQYLRLSYYTKPSQIEWSVKEITDELFHAEAHYEYSVNGKNYSGTTDFDNVAFRNGFAVEKALPEYKKKNWLVWYDSSNIEYSTLQKKFPIKECLSAILLVALLIYFYGLAYYIDKTKDKG
jgi:hypothetical protein